MTGEQAMTQLSSKLDPSRTAILLSGPAGQSFVFGLDWSPLVGANPKGQGLMRARALRATHFVMVGTGAMAVGTTRLTIVQQGKKVALYSAAAHFAQRYPTGAFGCLIPFEGQGCWMVASHAGVVLANTDRWFADLAEALEAMAPIRARFPALQVLTESTLTTQSMPTWLLENLSSESRLQPARHLSRMLKRNLLLLVVLGGLSVCVHRYCFSEQPIEYIEQPDALQMWRQALQKRSETISIHPEQSVTSVTQTWHQVPVRPVGWKLRNIHCEAGEHAWQCAAHFDRQHKFSLNQDLENIKPSAWTMRVTPLESAAWVWHVPYQPVPHDWTIPAKNHDWMTHLQRIGLAFEQIQVGSGAVLPLAPPVDARGQAIARPSALPVWHHRSLFLKGPLRSLVMLNGMQVPIRWRRASLELGTLSGQGAASSSALTLELTGEIFETRSY
jgi:hypothetical protein